MAPHLQWLLVLARVKTKVLTRIHLTRWSCLPPVCHCSSHGSFCSSYTGLLATLWIFWPTPASGPLHLLFPIPGIFFFSWYPHNWFPYLHWNATCQWDLAWITIFKTTSSLFQEFLSSFLCFFFFLISLIYISIYRYTSYFIILCDFLCVCVCAQSFQSCPTLCDPMDCSPPDSSVYGIL